MKPDKLKQFLTARQYELNSLLSKWNFRNPEIRSRFATRADLEIWFRGETEKQRQEIERVEAAKEKAKADAVDVQQQQQAIERETKVDHTTASDETISFNATTVEYFIYKNERFHIPGQKGELRRFQWNGEEKIYDILWTKQQSACYLQAGVGTGKTYIAGAVCKRAFDEGKLNNSMSPYKVLVVTKANVVKQFSDVMVNHFGFQLDDEVLVTNYEQFRSDWGRMFLQSKTKVKNGEPYIEYEWIPFMTPPVVIIDEGHSLKNEDSTQSKIFRALIKVPGVKIIFMSATAATRVADMRTFYCAVKRKLSDIYAGVFSSEEYPLCDDQWKPFSSSIAVKGNPYDHAPAAMEKFAKIFAPWIINIPTPTGKFRSYNKTELVDFSSEEDKQTYFRAYERYLEACARKKKEPAKGVMAFLVEQNIFIKCAEELHASAIAERVAKAVAAGKAPCFCAKYKSTIAKVVRLLICKYNFKRTQISLIWGGNNLFSAENRLSPERMQELLTQHIMGKEISSKLLKQIEEQLAESVEDTKVVEETSHLDLRLGTQTREQRQKEIRNFQTGKTIICGYTFSAGGVGLSLHHTDMLDDGTRVSLLPRENYITPTWSAQDIIQAFGRPHRSIFSLSDTFQTVLGFKGTVEVKVLEKNKRKLACLSKLLRSKKESWYALLDKDYIDKEETEEPIVEDNNQVDINETESSEDEEEQEN